MATRLSRGRQYPEPEHPFRPLFQRDRERIVHCSAFRRLMLKTQVLVAATNDHHRTRLTHTLEVAQVSRTIARQLGLNEDLTEAIALSHDLGHPPFGHAGEAALDDCMAGHGGFDHNLHAPAHRGRARVAATPSCPGLNLSWEVREAMAHHSKRRDDPAAAGPAAAGEPLLEARSSMPPTASPTTRTTSTTPSASACSPSTTWTTCRSGGSGPSAFAATPRGLRRQRFRRPSSGR